MDKKCSHQFSGMGDVGLPWVLPMELDANWVRPLTCPCWNQLDLSTPYKSTKSRHPDAHLLTLGAP